MSADTIVPDQTNPQSWNRYGYVLNNPLKYTDPTGHAQACEDGDVCWSPNTTSNSTSGNGRHRRHRQGDDLDPYPNCMSSKDLGQMRQMAKVWTPGV